MRVGVGEALTPTLTLTRTLTLTLTLTPTLTLALALTLTKWHLQHLAGAVTRDVRPEAATLGLAAEAAALLEPVGGRVAHERARVPVAVARGAATWKG